MIDWDRVIELRDEVGANDFDEVLELFLDEVETVVMRIADDSQQALQSDLHFLKGSALNLGFRALGSLCQDGEAHLSTGLGAAVTAQAVIACYGASKQVFVRDLAHAIGRPGSEAGAA